MSTIIQGLLDSVLGHRGMSSGKGNVKYVCPFHQSVPAGKHKLEVQTITDEQGQNKWRCWVCGAKGKTIRSLFRQMGAPKSAIESLSKIIVKGEQSSGEVTHFNGILPEEYVFLPNASPYDILAKHARYYLKKRGITEEDIIKYQIGYCPEGVYGERLIFPSYDATGNMNFFVSRKFDEEDNYMKYKLPDVSKDIIFWEMFINWDAPVTLCEGWFDMAAIKRNVIPLLGKDISPSLMKKLLSSRVRKIYVALDKDALKKALEHCQTFIAHGKKVYLVELEDKDPSLMGFEEYTRHIQKAKPLTLSRIMQLKMKLL